MQDGMQLLSIGFKSLFTRFLSKFGRPKRIETNKGVTGQLFRGIINRYHLQNIRFAIN
jgi:hypothetical protein